MQKDVRSPSLPPVDTRWAAAADALAVYAMTGCSGS